MSNIIFKKREAGIPFSSQNRLIIIPLILSLIMVIFAPLFIGASMMLIFSPSGTSLISVYSTSEMILTVLFTLFIFTKVSKVSLTDLGLKTTGAFSKIVIGIVCGFLAISIVAFVINMLGGVTTEYHFQPQYLKTLLLGLVFFAFQGTYEELVYRSYLMTHFSKAMGIKWSIVMTSILFTGLHVLNPGMTLMPVINLMIASVVFSLIYYKSGSLWLVGFAHGIWNYSQGFIYGSLVSGNPIDETIFRSLPLSGNDFISGGSFGFEGGIVTTVVGLILITTLIILPSKQVKL
ncbi:CAAX amino terminal protease self- immunity [Phocoenobacter uteri]|uniref:CAAX amino terminal protease self- immunity n=1 Tax=Phocoenobacter uteri TaxID=146806 RepID=A0A379C8L4_9PAST|nr:CPBP family intramembrane glutamic endopeptidase [Phocoenobacter uteri]MDG6882404.1 hypothetical protein [Phocoenobacter uteri]SUB58561.1 CAAX amino terminal protease self- immunity [Phocoenobacter uteri]